MSIPPPKLDPEAIRKFLPTLLPNTGLPRTLGGGTGSAPAGYDPERHSIPLIVAPVPPQPSPAPPPSHPHPKPHPHKPPPKPHHPAAPDKPPVFGDKPSYPVANPVLKPQPNLQLTTGAPQPPTPPKPVTAIAPVGDPQFLTGKDGRHVSLRRTNDGGIEVTCPPPPIREITFAGGGGKGNVYPGVVDSLERNGVLAKAKELHGASAGSMTASMLACGMNADEFRHFTDDNNFKAVIDKDVPRFDVRSSGKALTTLLRSGMDATIARRIGDYLAQNQGKPLDPAIAEIQKRLASGSGPTFRDLRILSKQIPAIKELTVTITRHADDDSSPESVVCSADTTPDLDVADAVHASSALPGAFNPVPLSLDGKKTESFRDGGLMNNAPSSDTLGKREVDPVPDHGSLTCVFEADENDDVAAGKAPPPDLGAGVGAGSGTDDFLLGILHDPKKVAEMDAADYGMRKTLAEHKEAVFKVPLTYAVGGKNVIDDRGLKKGTLAFDMPSNEKFPLRGQARDNMNTYLEGRSQPRRISFKSTEEMLNEVPDDDLRALADNGVDGAKQALKFRAEVATRVAHLEQLAAATPPDMAKIQEILDELDGLTNTGAERAAYVGRQLNRSGKLDALLQQLRQAGASPKRSHVLQAGLATNDQVEAKAQGRDIDAKALRMLIATTPITPAGKSERAMLLAAEDKVRAATSFTEIRDALTPVIQYFDSGKATLMNSAWQKWNAAEPRDWAHRALEGPGIQGAQAATVVDRTPYVAALHKGYDSVQAACQKH